MSGGQNSFEHIKEIKVTLTLFPPELTIKDIEKVIVNKLVNTYENVCYDDMFIKEITNISPIQNGKVGQHGEVNYVVKFEARVLSPQQNDVISGTIQKIIASGIFVRYDSLRCFVKKQCFDTPTWNSLKINNTVKVQLKTFRFQNFNRTLSCVGEAI